MGRKILVIGATGVVGSDLTKRLVELGETVRAATRNPLESARRFPVKAEFVELDLERPETFAPALHGADRVFLMARPEHFIFPQPKPRSRTSMRGISPQPPHLPLQRPAMKTEPTP